MTAKKSFLIALAITCLAFPVSLLLVLNPFERSADFALSDFYTRAAMRKADPTISKEVVIVGVDGLSRKETADVVAYVDYFKPKVVALDVFMEYPSESDSSVVSVLNECSTLMLPEDLNNPEHGPVYSNVKPAYWGYANLEATQHGAVVRRFCIEKDGKQALAAIAAGRGMTSDSIGNDGLIVFQGHEFDVIGPEELVKLGSSLEGKIVLVGNLSDISDRHPTPIGEMAGVLIHANIIQTIIDGSVPKEAGRTWCMILAFCISLLLMWAHVRVNHISGEIANLALRISQLVMLYLIYLAGSLLFIKFGLYVDFALTILLVAAASVAFDVFYGVAAIFRRRAAARSGK